MNIDDIPSLNERISFIESLRGLEHNWNGEGAQPFSNRCIDNTIYFTKLCYEEFLIPYFIKPKVTKQKPYIQLYFGKEKTIEYYLCMASIGFDSVVCNDLVSLFEEDGSYNTVTFRNQDEYKNIIKEVKEHISLRYKEKV